MTKKDQCIEYFDSLHEAPLPEVLSNLEEEDLEQVKTYVEAFLEKEREGLDRLFESMSPTMKYIPNFLLVALTKKFIDPPIAARITEKLQIKQAVSVASSLQSDYIAEVVFYLDVALSAELLEALPKKFSRAVISELLAKHPLILLDVLSHTSTKVYSMVELDRLLDATSNLRLNRTREQVLEILRSHK